MNDSYDRIRLRPDIGYSSVILFMLVVGVGLVFTLSYSFTWIIINYELNILILLTFSVFITVMLIICRSTFCILIATSRTLELTNEGVTISFLWIKRSLKWDELPVRQILTNKPGVPSERIYYSYNRCVIFNKEGLDLSKREKWPLLKYLIFKTSGPFSSFFVFFTDPTKPYDFWWQRPPWPKMYLTEEALFLQILKQWGIELR